MWPLVLPNTFQDKHINEGVSWCCLLFLGVCLLLWCGYCSISFESFVLHHLVLQIQETTTKEENLKPAKQRFKSQNKFLKHTHLLLILKSSSGCCSSSCSCCSSSRCNCCRSCSCCRIGCCLWEWGCIRRNWTLLVIVVATSRGYARCGACTSRVTVLPLEVLSCCGRCFLWKPASWSWRIPPWRKKKHYFVYLFGNESMLIWFPVYNGKYIWMLGICEPSKLRHLDNHFEVNWPLKDKGS